MELSKLRTVKNAQTDEINKQINELEVNIENLETDTSITAAQKNAKTVEYKNKINELTIQKNRIAEKYKVDKKKLQIMMKRFLTQPILSGRKTESLPSAATTVEDLRFLKLMSPVQML